MKSRVSKSGISASNLLANRDRLLRMTAAVRQTRSSASRRLNLTPTEVEQFAPCSDESTAN